MPIINWGNGRRAVCDAHIDAPFGSTTRIPLYVEYLFVHDVEGPRKRAGAVIIDNGKSVVN